jgi:hypothetical protein
MRPSATAAFMIWLSRVRACRRLDALRPSFPSSASHVATSEERIFASSWEPKRGRIRDRRRHSETHGPLIVTAAVATTIAVAPAVASACAEAAARAADKLENWPYKLSPVEEPGPARGEGPRVGRTQPPPGQSGGSRGPLGSAGTGPPTGGPNPEGPDSPGAPPSIQYPGPLSP